GDDVTMTWAGREIADYVKAFCGGAQIGIGELAAVGDREIGTGDLERDDADFRFARGDLSSSKVRGSHVVVIPEIQVDRLSAREQLPDLGRENSKVRAPIGGSLGSRVC